MSRTFILVKPNRKQVVTWRLPHWCLTLFLRLTGWTTEPLVTLKADVILPKAMTNVCQACSECRYEDCPEARRIMEIA